MSVEEIKKLAEKVPLEIVNKGNFALYDEIFAPDFIDHTTPPGVPPTREGQRQLITMFRAAFPDVHYTIDKTIAEGDTVVHLLTATGTMRGQFLGIAPTGKQATWKEVHIGRFSGGKFVEHWGLVDQLGMLAQLGVTQIPGPPVPA